MMTWMLWVFWLLVLLAIIVYAFVLHVECEAARFGEQRDDEMGRK